MGERNTGFCKWRSLSAMEASSNEEEGGFKESRDYHVTVKG